MKVPNFLTDLLFPPKCILCGKLLRKGEIDLCHNCRSSAPWFETSHRNIPHLATWTSIWYYEDMVRDSLLRYKFCSARSYSHAYGRLLAIRILEKTDTEDAVLTWVPVSRQRKWKRGYDQDQLLAEAVGKELGIPPIATLRKIRNNPPQSGITGAAQRKANVLGVYKPVKTHQFSGRRVILVDDILTTGATASECARVLLTAGAREVICATVAVAHHQHNDQ